MISGWRDELQSNENQMPGLNFNTCKDQLHTLGLREGDAVLVRAGLAAIGPLEDDRARADFFIDALLDTIGASGLLVGLAFSKNDWRCRLPKRPPFDPGEPAVTGGFVSAMLGRPGAVRSRHPTNSFVAIGRDAAGFLAGHDERAACFSPMSGLIEHGGKMLLVGCEASSPGFSTVHLAQNALGLDTRTWMSLILGRRYVDRSGKVRWYRKKDVPGCSMGFGKFYASYRARNALREGRIGAADAMLLAAGAAYDIEHEMLAEDPTLALCDRDSCMTCRIGWYYKPLEFRRYLTARLRG